MKYTFAPESRPLDGYTIKRAIHRGGFGEVYYAVTDSGREVALKLLQHNTDVELRGVQQCLNLSHPNLVTIFDVRQDADEDHWIIMEYVAGDTLDAVIRKHPQGMPLELVRKWVTGIVAGVGYLHSRGLVHRDLKPANVFSSGESIKVGDIGLSKFITHSRRSAQTQSVGTVYYMAPEVAKGRYGKEVDVYALGVIVYEMLTGQLPFDGESTGEILMKHLAEQPDLSLLPPRLQGVIGRALEKDPAQRFASMQEFGQAFEDALLGREPQSRPTQRNTASGTQAGDKHWLADELIDVELVEDAPSRRAAAKSAEEPQWPLVGLIPSPRVLMVMAAVAVVAIMFLVDSGRFEERLVVGLLMGGLTYFWLTLIQNTPITEVREFTKNLLHPGPGANARLSSLPPRERARRRIVGQYLGAAALAVPVIGVLLAGAMLIAPQTLMLKLTGSGALSTSMLTFVAASSVSMTWLLLFIPAIYRLWYGETSRRRLPYAFGGLVGGLLCSVLAQYLLIESPPPGGIFEELGDHRLFALDGVPTALGFIVFAMLLFTLRNWREQSSVTRTRRFSLMKVLGSVVVAWLISAVFAFPHPLAVLWAVVVSIAVQVCSPYYERPSRTAGR
ncbi:MAG: protein kinase [Planctomycetaceae bacterium]|nr:protein kinase [Planctomycetaceae bacterium]